MLYAILVNGISEFALTKFDVLVVLDQITVCTGYLVDGKSVKSFPADVTTLNKVECVYETYPGWKCSLDGHTIGIDTV